ncbi:MAG TPA: T9SS type A sorting domain-containing protein [Bacteroidota bacterium]|nr:T9SS type A sorting domain-containing protein [Bacteroidota bacterium]
MTHLWNLVKDVNIFLIAFRKTILTLSRVDKTTDRGYEMKKFGAISYTLLTILLSISDVQGEWKQLPVGSTRGGLWTVAMAGSNVFSGTSGGIFRSTNNGVTWTNVSNIYTLCFTLKGSECFAGTEDKGVIVSTDNGETWVQRDLGFTAYIEALATMDSTIFAGGEGGMFRSTDDGASWTAIENGMSAYQAMVTGLAVDGTRLLATTHDGLMISTDEGDSWANLVSNGLPSGLTNCILIHNSIALEGTPSGVVRSTDDGISWNSDNTGLPKVSGSYVPILSLAANQNMIFAGTSSGLYISMDSGATWNSSNDGLPGNQIFSIAIEDTTLFVATINNGVFRSIDNGASWTSTSSGIVLSEVNSIAGNGSDVFAVMDHNSLYSSTDNGATWAADTALHGGIISSLTVLGQDVYAMTNSGIYVSSDKGKTWNTINGGVIDTTHPSMLVQSASNLVSATQDSGGVFLSSDNGTTWKNVGQYLPELASLATSGSNVVAGTHDGVYLSTDNGETWSNGNDTLININTLASAGSIVFGGRYFWPFPIGFSPPSPPGGVFLSTDGGLTWSPFSSGIPFNPQVYAIAVHGKYVFAGAEPGLYTSTISNNNWVNMGENLPDGPVLSLFINDSSVFVGTELSGIWCASLSAVTGVNQPIASVIPGSFQLEQNYPNPFNPSTTISYQISEVANVKLRVYDILGRQVATLVDAKQYPGNYKAVFNAGNIASGVYFYRLEVKNYMAARKMAVIK